MARPYQIVELTRGIDLPLPGISDAHLTVLAEFLVEAWTRLNVAHPEKIGAATEAELNALMESRLNGMILEDELWSDLVVCVARGRETLSYDGHHLEKRPDLSLFLTRRHPSFPMIVECKILETPSKTVEMYCSNGLRRFLTGEYAWATREAFMLGYVRNGCTIATSLTPLLTAASGPLPHGFQVQELPTSKGIASADAAASTHERTFTYIHTGLSPGCICVWHVWLVPA